MLKARLSATLAAVLLFCFAAFLPAEEKPDNAEKKTGAEKKTDGWISLFNGSDLTGWKASEGVEWKVENGEIVTPPKRSHLFTEMEFKNFEFKADCLTKPGSNSGLYFHTKYED